MSLETHWYPLACPLAPDFAAGIPTLPIFARLIFLAYFGHLTIPTGDIAQRIFWHFGFEGLEASEGLHYTDVNYWDKRFEDEKEYEWIANFDQCSRLIVPYLKPDHRILHLGCGNSKLSFQLSQTGFPNVTNVDYSTP
ncbi:endothelin-converting enzyme 2 [Ditylenchus destructor]|nr:endothelin-converting enzyme 2 [Ditylenchus destructor]